jgi:FkbM family methyltransferase
VTARFARLLFRLNRSRIWQRSIRLHGHRYDAPSADRLLALLLYRLGVLGSGDRAIFSQHVGPGMKVADIGANQGLYTLLFSQLVGRGGVVFAFEPEPELFRALERNCAVNGASNVRPFRVALGDEDRTAVLQRGLLHWGDNRLGLSRDVAAWLQVEVAMKRLDGLLGGERLDFVKLDVQGYELAVLRGMEKTLAGSPRLKVYFEFWPHGLEQAGTGPDEVIDFFVERGFAVVEPASGRECKSAPRMRGKAAYTNLIAWRPGRL